ncbi:Hypothetical protein, putative DUF669 family phage protein [Mycoplasmopsis agalactiae 14628]|uniref:DUF669 domain-containing protein n=1 Tax=Mycoplasmopsis agalactiae 14628 TaxID=1110504 RepID=I5D687_MYCAA|nr:hypothetical protein [Mycoplasmopsis agalactiae]EIN15196.1 Hypothetical protein, putative DUF669 family phage protein [Mycoplasmopsis agalactiae 14628]
MAINFNKTWEQRQTELINSQQNNKIDDGTYVAKITSANLKMHDKYKVQVVEIAIEITEGENKGKTDSKVYFIDDNYPNAKKRNWDLSQLVNLLSAYGLSFNNEREFYNTLYDLKDKTVEYKIERSTQTNEKGYAYLRRYINPIVNVSKTAQNAKVENKKSDLNIGFVVDSFDEMI